MKLYMAVTADQYELPLIVTPSATEMARFVQQSVSQMYGMIWHHKNTTLKRSGVNRGYNVLRIEVEDDE